MLITSIIYVTLIFNEKSMKVRENEQDFLISNKSTKVPKKVK